MGEYLSSSRDLFRSFLQAGVECSTHINTRGNRLDLLESTKHRCFAEADFERLRSFGIRTVRSAARWHLIERTPGTYNFSSLDWQLDAAQAAGIEVVLDILHFGVPDGVDVFATDFPERFGAFTRALAEHLERRGNECRCITPVNEISFMAWAGGEKAAIGPFATGRGGELKRNLVRAAIRASNILRDVMGGVRLIAPEPAIHIVGNPDIPGDEEEASCYTLAYFEAWDLLSGRLEPELGGAPEYLDVIGVNFYWRNEWQHNSGPIDRHDPRWRSFARILCDIWERYRRPMFVSETGTEDDYRAEWFEYICDEVMTAIQRGVPVKGICWYPILNHLGWDDDRYCQNGLFDCADELGARAVHSPLAEVFVRQQERFRSKDLTTYETGQARPDLFLTPSLGVRVPETSALNEPLWP